jgi:hypothetical protein
MMAEEASALRPFAGVHVCSQKFKNARLYPALQFSHVSTRLLKFAPISAIFVGSFMGRRMARWRAGSGDFRR